MSPFKRMIFLRRIKIKKRNYSLSLYQINGLSNNKKKATELVNLRGNKGQIFYKSV